MDKNPNTEELLAALRPFSEFADAIDPDQSDNEEICYGVGLNGGHSLFVDDFRSAARVYASAEQAHAAKNSPFLDRAIEQARANPPTPDMLGSWRDPAAKDSPTLQAALAGPCPICNGIEGCDHTVPERTRALASLPTLQDEGVRAYVKEAKEAWDRARNELGYSRSASWAMEYGPRLIDLATLSRGEAAEPIPMILHCPKCGLQHIDAPDPAGLDVLAAFDTSGAEPNWTNPPHRSHLCHGCGHIWRPADVPTEGVAEIKTRGKNDSPAHHEAGGATGRDRLALMIAGWPAHLDDRGPDNEVIGDRVSHDHGQDLGEVPATFERLADAILALWAGPFSEEEDPASRAYASPRAVAEILSPDQQGERPAPDGWEWVLQPVSERWPAYDAPASHPPSDQQGREQVIGELCEVLKRAGDFIEDEADNRAHAGSEHSDYEREPREIVEQIDAALSRARSAAQ